MENSEKRLAEAHGRASGQTNIGRTDLISRVHLKNVGPPPGLLATRSLDEGHTLRRGHGEAVWMPGDVLGGGHLQHAGHVDPRLRHRLGLQRDREKRGRKKKKQKTRKNT